MPLRTTISPEAHEEIDRVVFYDKPLLKFERLLETYLLRMDVAASIQQVTEEIVLRLARTLRRETGAESLCLAGGVALNCVANGRLLRESGFRRIWIQPAAGDAGGAIGAALAAWHQYLTARVN